MLVGGCEKPLQLGLPSRALGGPLAEPWLVQRTPRRVRFRARPQALGSVIGWSRQPQLFVCADAWLIRAFWPGYFTQLPAIARLSSLMLAAGHPIMHKFGGLRAHVTNRTCRQQFDLIRVIDRVEKRIERWPRLMTARTAAAYCDERSPYSFRRAVGRLWPHPVRVPGKGARWLKEDLDLAIDQLTFKNVRDAADVL